MTRYHVTVDSSGGSVSRGKARGLRRYRRKVCGKTFGALADTALSGLHHKERWLSFGESLAEEEMTRVRRALRDCAEHGASLAPPLPGGGSASAGPACRDRRGRRDLCASEPERRAEAELIAAPASVCAGTLHIQTVNSRHSEIKGFLRAFRGIATKYLDSYLVVPSHRTRRPAIAESVSRGGDGQTMPTNRELSQMNTASRNNLLIVISDEHRKDAMGCVGHPIVKTPNLDRLAARGTIFENAYTPSPICVPARASIACGDYVHNIGCWDSATPYCGVPGSWMHKLRDSGIEVISIGKLHYRSSKDDNGFSREILPMHVMGGIGWPAGLLRESPPAFESAQELAADVGAGASSYTDYDRAITEAACDWLLIRGETDNPWAAFFSLVSPHYPLIAPQEFYDLYDRASVDLPIAYEHAQRPRHSELMNLARFFDYDRHFDARKLREAKAAYYGLISFMDDCVGRILSALTRSGQTDDTVVIYVSDHGDMMGDHGFWTKHVMYEASAGIPMIAAGPDVAEGRRVQTGTSLVDLAATAVDVTGLCDHGAAELFPGRSLRSIAGEEDDRNRTTFSEYHDGGSTTGAFMVRWEDWKFVYYVGHDPQLFNLAQDPHELDNLAYEGVNDPVVLAAWRDGESRLRAICDPEEVNARCIADQRRKIAELGGVEACKNAYVFNHTPAPDEQ